MDKENNMKAVPGSRGNSVFYSYRERRLKRLGKYTITGCKINCIAKNPVHISAFKVS